MSFGCSPMALSCGKPDIEVAERRAARVKG